MTLVLLLGVSHFVASQGSEQTLGGTGGGGLTQDLDTATLEAGKIKLSLTGVDSTHEINAAVLDTKRTNEEIQDQVDFVITMGANGLLTKNYDDPSNSLTLAVLARTLELSGDSLSILGGNKIDLSGLASGGGGGGGDVYKNGTPLLNQYAKWINDSVIIGSTLITDNGTDVIIPTRLGLNGRSPGAPFAIQANGQIILYNGSNYSQIKDNGEIILNRSGTAFAAVNEGAVMSFRLGGLNALQIQLDRDVEVKENFYAAKLASFNTTTPPGIAAIRTRGSGNTKSTYSLYAQSLDNTHTFGITDIGTVTGKAINYWLFPTLSGRVSRSWIFPGNVRDPFLNNAFFNADERFIVAATNTTNTAYNFWFNSKQSIACDINATSTAVVSIDVAGNGGYTPDGIVYPNGKILVTTYINHPLGACTGRYKDRDGNWTNMTFEGEVFSPGINPLQKSALGNVYSFDLNGDNYITDFELTLVNDNAFNARVLAIEYYPEREPILPFFTKYEDQRTFKAMTFMAPDRSENVIIDPDAVVDLKCNGISQFTTMYDRNGNIASSNDIWCGDTAVVGGWGKRDYHDFNDFTQTTNTTPITNVNSFTWTEFTEMDSVTIDYSNGATEYTSGLKASVQGVFCVSGSISLDASAGMTLDVSLFVNGVQTGVIQTYNYFGALPYTFTFPKQMLKLNADDKVSIRARRNSPSGSVSISDIGQSHLLLEFKHRGH